MFSRLRSPAPRPADCRPRGGRRGPRPLALALGAEHFVVCGVLRAGFHIRLAGHLQAREIPHAEIPQVAHDCLELIGQIPLLDKPPHLLAQDELQTLEK